VLRATDECTTVLARVINTKLCISILNPLSDMAECPMNLAAIKIEEKVIRSASESDARAVLDRVVPTLIKVWLMAVNNMYQVQDCDWAQIVVTANTIIAEYSNKESTSNVIHNNSNVDFIIIGWNLVNLTDSVRSGSDVCYIFVFVTCSI